MALGDTITIQLVQSISGLGAKGDVLTLTETTYIEAVMAAGWAVLYAGSNPATTIGQPVSTAKMVITTAERKRARANLGLDNINRLTKQERSERRLAQTSTDITTVAMAAATHITGTPVTYAAATGGVINAAYPADLGQGLDLIAASSIYVYPNTPKGLTQHSIRFMTDSDKVTVLLWNSLGTYAAELFIDGVPYASNPVAVASAQFMNITFPSAKTRLVEIRTTCAVGSIQVSPLYSAWKPRPLHGPRVLLVGDSYWAPLVYTAAGGSDVTNRGAIQGIEDHIGIEDCWVEAVGGTGYLRRTATGGYSPNNNYLDRLPDHIRIAPDVLVVGGGGANDFFAGYTVAQTQAQVEAYFTQARAALPDAKLVFVEGFSPPVTYSTYNANYTALATNILTSLAGLGIYVIDVATTSPWISPGGGYIPGHTNGLGNSDNYIGTDGIHPTAAGAAYIKSRLAPRLAAIIDGVATINTRV